MEIRISWREIPSDPSMKIKLAAKIILPSNRLPPKRKNMHNTHRKRLPTPKNCIFLIRTTRFLRMTIWLSRIMSGVDLYCACRLRMREPRARNLLVYATRRSETAGKSRAGVVSVISMVVFYFNSGSYRDAWFLFIAAHCPAGLPWLLRHQPCSL